MVAWAVRANKKYSPTGPDIRSAVGSEKRFVASVGVEQRRGHQGGDHNFDAQLPGLAAYLAENLLEDHHAAEIHQRQRGGEQAVDRRAANDDVDIEQH